MGTIVLDYLTLPRHKTRRYRKRRESAIRFAVIHHSGTETGTPLAFARYHTWVRGWPGIGYHYVITRDGVIHKTNPLLNISYHARGGNKSGVGICLVGRENFTEEQVKSLDSLVKKLVRLLYVQIIGHREVRGSSTTCPGNYLMAWIENARR